VSADDSVYAGREQSQIKHEVLRRYLESFAHKIGSWSKSITYIDGFSGPWNSVSPDFKDSSFGIAMHELRRARDTLRPLKGALRIRCFFVERDRAAYKSLAEFAAAQTSSHTDADTVVETRNASFEDSIDDIVEFVRRDRETFVFTFIDPKGWAGFAMQRIRPLIQLSPGEVLVNFMTSHIVRWIADEATKVQLVETFGTDVSAEVTQLSGIDRMDRCVELYCQALREIGNFNYVCPAVVLKPTQQQAHYHLIYGTRHTTGVDVFKKAEKKAMEVGEKARAAADERKKAQSGQISFLDPEDMPESAYYNTLRERYTGKAKDRVVTLLQSDRRVLYREAWIAALAEPLVWEDDLRTWIKEWVAQGRVVIEGLAAKERVPKHDKNHTLVWTSRP